MAHSKMAPKRKVNVKGQKHSLAYINDREKRMLRKAGGSGKPGPNGIPTYDDLDEGYGAEDMGGAAGGSPGTGGGSASDDVGGGFGGGSDRDDNSFDTPQYAKDIMADKVKARPEPFTGLAKYSVVGNIGNAIAKGVRGKIAKELKAGGIAVKNKKGEVMGVMHDGPFGLGKVYSGRTMAAEDYAGPEEFRNNVTLDGGRDGNDNVRGGAANKVVTPQDLVDGKVNLPDAPTGGEGGDATDDAKNLSKMGKESTIATTAQGLLGSAKTRNRSLMSGLIS